MRVEITGPARSDLREIAAYIARDNARRARSFTAELRDKALAIGNTPHGFPVIRTYDTHDVRHRPFRDYVIFYRVKKDVVQILRILHSTRDTENLI